MSALNYPTIFSGQRPELATGAHAEGSIFKHLVRILDYKGTVLKMSVPVLMLIAGAKAAEGNLPENVQ